MKDSEEAQREDPIAEKKQQPKKEPVEFDPRQQAKLDEIVKEVMGRAGSEAKAKAAQLQLDVDRLQQELAAERLKTGGSPDAGTQALAAQLAELTAERDALRSDKQESLLNESLRKAIGDMFVDSNLAVQVLRNRVLLIDGKPTVVAEDGTPRLNSSYQPFSLEEAARELAMQKPFMARGTVQGGAGSTEARMHEPQTDALVERLFGKNSDAGEANALAKRDIRKYHRFKEIARKKGLIN